MINETRVYRSHVFRYDADDTYWFELKPYAPADPGQDWLPTRVELWNEDGPAAVLSTNAGEQFKRPLNVFYANPSEYLQDIIESLVEEGLIERAQFIDKETGQLEDLLPPQRLGMHREPARAYFLTAKARARFEHLPRHWPASREVQA